MVSPFWISFQFFGLLPFRLSLNSSQRLHFCARSCFCDEKSTTQFTLELNHGGNFAEIAKDASAETSACLASSIPAFNRITEEERTEKQSQIVSHILCKSFNVALLTLSSALHSTTTLAVCASALLPLTYITLHHQNGKKKNSGQVRHAGQVNILTDATDSFEFIAFFFTIK